MTAPESARAGESRSMNSMLAVGLGLAVLIGGFASFAAYQVGKKQGETQLAEQLAEKEKQIEGLKAEVAKAKVAQKSGKTPPPPVTATSLTAVDLGVAALTALSAEQQALALGVLNTKVGPCDPCIDAGLSLAACFKTKGELCTNMGDLVGRAARLASQGKSAEDLAGAITYEAGWAPIDLTGSPSMGPENAPVVLVEYTDFQCPFCSRSQATIAEIEEKYGARLRVVYKSFPLAKHKLAQPAAIAAMAADRQGKFWEFKAAVFERQRELKDEAVLEQIAKDLGLNLARWNKDRADPAIEAQIKADVAQAKRLGVTGTPCFFVNGYKLKGAKPVAAFEDVIDRELADRAR